MPANQRYRIVCDGEIIGTSELEERDASMGVASGRFEPTPAYERVAPVFRLFIAAQADGEAEPVPDKLAAYEAARARLVLALTDEAGQPIETAGVAVLDYSGEAGVDAADAHEVEVYFSTPRQFSRLT